MTELNEYKFFQRTYFLWNLNILICMSNLVLSSSRISKAKVNEYSEKIQAVATKLATPVVSGYSRCPWYARFFDTISKQAWNLKLLLCCVSLYSPYINCKIFSGAKYVLNILFTVWCRGRFVCIIYRSYSGVPLMNWNFELAFSWSISVMCTAYGPMPRIFFSKCVAQMHIT